MRKNLLILGSLVFSACLNAQIITFVGNNATVTVKDGALVYSGGGWRNDGNGKVSNEGDIMVVGGSAGTDVFEVASGAEFRLKYINTSTYGQLYINGISQTTNISGKVVKEFKADANHSDYVNTTSDLGRQQTALPFYGFTIADLKAALETSAGGAANWLNTTSATLNYTGRFNVASVFKYNNARARYDQIAGATTTVVGAPTDYYILPRRSQDASGLVFTQQWNPANGNAGTPVDFKGTPASAEDSNASVNISGAAAGIDFGINGNTKNYYYERYNSYIIDPFRVGGGSTGSPTWVADYGKNLYQIANPFLTNIDLRYIGNNEGANGDGIEISGLLGVAKFKPSTINWRNGLGSTYTTSPFYTATWLSGAFQLGDANAMLIKPMEEFYLKMDGSASNSTTFKMQNTRRFAQTSRSSADYSVTGKTSSIPADKLVKQVAVVLKNAEGEELGRTYYGVFPSASTGISEFESYQAYVMDNPIYTKEELATGGEDTSQPAKLYINVANEVDFAKKEIPLKIPAVDGTSLSFEVYEGGERLQDNEQLSSGKFFYIKINNEVTKITDGANIALTSGNYGLYYDAPENFLANSDAAYSQTIIAKKDSNWVIRFAKNWKSADVEVYSAAGQLIHSKKKVSTSQDYIIPMNINTNGLFIVRTTSEGGEVVTKKIVK